MKKTISLFMWGYQPHFRVLMEIRARDVLQLIAPQLQVRTLLVGVRTPEQQTGHAVCVEPEDEDWDPRIFFNCAARAESIYASHPDHSKLYGDEPTMRDKPENIRRKSVREAIEEVLTAYDSSHSTTSFCGTATRVGGYHVVPILQFDRVQLAGYPKLPAPIQFDDLVAPSGLLEATILCLLEQASDALARKEPGRLVHTYRVDPTAVLRDAGDRFCGAITFATGDLMLQEVFHSLNLISSMPYEGTEAIGNLLFAPASAGVIDLRVQLKEPVPFRDYKLARKIIEMTGQSLSCVCYGAQGISGIGVPLNTSADGVFRVRFTGHYKWDLYYKNLFLMQSAFDVPRLPMPPIEETAFRSTLRRVFHRIREEEERCLWNIVQAAIDQKHGTIIAMSAAAAEEASRLRTQSLTIKPVKLTADLVRRLTAIDGALLIDTEGVCYAIGVILDGMATESGDPSRGARYNSAVRYVTSRANAKIPSMCTVVSADGYVNIVPDLRPQIRKSEVANHVALLKTKTIDNYHKTRNWLDEHRFYLTAEQCETVNEELARIHGAPQEVGELRLELRKFVSDPLMNDSYYSPEAGETF
jgi:hypothetical protein